MYLRTDTFGRAAEDHPLRVERINLQGERTELFSLDNEACSTKYIADEVYSIAAVGLKWSPDSRYLAYYLRYNAGSLSTDEVPIQVMDLQNPGKPLNLGDGLHYAEWFAWSPDSRQLAFIRGIGREFTSNKHLAIVDMTSKIVKDCGQAGQAEIQPVWINGDRRSLVFCRGPEYSQAGNLGQSAPTRRIWQLEADGTEKPLTAGTDGSADFFPEISPDGQYMSYVRVTGWERTSIYLKPLDGGQEVELLHDLVGFNTRPMGTGAIGHGTCTLYFDESKKSFK